MSKFKLLVIDDDVTYLRAISSLLESRSYAVTPVDNGEEAIAILKENKFDLVITDLVMDNTDGLEILKEVKDYDPEIPVIVLTGYGDMDSAVMALRLRASDFIQKPCNTDELFFRVESCLDRLEMNRKLKVYEKILSICCRCKKIRDDNEGDWGEGNWLKLEDYIKQKTESQITVAYCPECAEKLAEELDGL